MKIIFSPAKEMSFDQSLKEDWQLSPQSQAVVQALKSLSPEEVAKTLKVKDKLLETNLAYIEDFDQGKTYPAISLYHGLAYRQLDLDLQKPAIQAYLGQQVRILSALYGPIPATQPIKPYRLDLSMPLKVEGQSLRKFWQGTFDQAFAAGERILNLASQEFASLLDADRYDWIDVDFYQLKAGKKKQHSTIAKKGRGLMLNYLVNHQVTDLSQVQAFSEAGYRYLAEESDDKHLTFVQDLD
ncbi:MULTISPECIES: peroxide stress protein YaaA [Aerococcus]|uniref:peroxide stress protein YaaA n=1 Tax=Aerococcus TaxID=1375 RepID=UPI000200EF03|nr:MULTISPECIES: peroxide stress protein YaaA [Aerococcus]AEA01177.1 hypothetical protein HMPREF9243_0370 [Aerococcus sp. Group 1]MCY3030698.1 peroxide stress protein YaaA [Aerococcus sp. Group 1]MCY3054329.1 peroxide stress protein YaaA [Aerococcus sp. Group 1]MCY3056059.1 peroxide stress protein YaaA [Aerococcus sp. Group 1]MCY3062029.1 peroxide stress protein YaaA [Aerococcus sp. Group 1]